MFFCHFFFRFVGDRCSLIADRSHGANEQLPHVFIIHGSVVYTGCSGTDRDQYRDGFLVHDGK